MLSRYKKYYLKVQYRHEKAISLLKEKNQKIEEQHSLITEQNKQLQNYNKGLQDNVFKYNLELEKKNKELQNKNENLEKFASIIAHDLKLPISQISGLLQIIPADFTDDFRVEEIIYRIRASASQLKEITDDLSRVVDVQLTKEIDSVNISDILISVLKNLEKYACENGTKIYSEVENDIIARGNPDFYSNIFNNIIHNAIKFSSKEDKPEVKVCLNSKSDIAYFNVIDNGIGYSGYKNEVGIGMYSAGGEPLSGKGYGLYLVKSQLDKIGGHININGKEIKGTEVKISIPLNDID
nr:HAMP domain-containing sensor histidine kinase [Mangrovivirga halotolerans]